MSLNMLATNCLNCKTDLGQGQQFCSACGQKSNTHRLSLAHFLHEGFHAMTHADKGIFHLLKCLTIRPGSTAREYLSGRRKAYFNPFTFFLLIMGVFVFLNIYFGAPQKNSTGWPGACQDTFAGRERQLCGNNESGQSGFRVYQKSWKYSGDVCHSTYFPDNLAIIPEKKL